jgi:EpsI family protein
MNFRLRNLILMVLMLAASGLAVALKPVLLSSEQQNSINLEKIIPNRFGTWAVVPGNVITVADPQQLKVLNKIYSQVLSRTYRDFQTGKTVMLMIAYGADQSKQSQVHFPEVCYPAQGFQIQDRTQGDLRFNAGAIPVIRLVATAEQRFEPITYWIRIGSRIVRGPIDQKLAIVAQGMTGSRTDGVLFRVSSIGKESAPEYATHEVFVANLFAAMEQGTLPSLIGKLAQSDQEINP